MLREVSIVRQIPGEPRRRWFASRNFDLFVWVDEHAAPIGFQLCYDKQDGEHAMTWTESSGYSHMAVDAGESRPARPKGTPILVADGTFDAARILDEFLGEAMSLPAEYARMVEARLRHLMERA